MKEKTALRWTAIFCLAFCAFCAPAVDGNRPRKVLNIVNFVRSADPRQPREEMVRAVREEVALKRDLGALKRATTARIGC